ncbi:MAG: hypothetical protein WCP52_08790 [Bacteroidota bacterium]
MKKILLLGSVVVLFIESCTFEKYEVPKVSSTASQCDSTVHFNPTIKNIFITQCGSGGHHCHNANTTDVGASPFNSDYTLIMQYVNDGSIMSRVVNLQGIPMPSAGPISDTLRSQLKCWISQGAPNN